MCEACHRVVSLPEGKAEQARCQACNGNLVIRADDAPQAINSRLDLFEEETLPVIEYYKAKGVLCSVNGERGIDEVRQDIKKCFQK